MKLFTRKPVPVRSGGQMAVYETVRGPRWSTWYRCPLIPQATFRSGNDQNTWSIHFHWLIFRLWTMDSVTLSAEVSLDDSQFMARVHVPYLIAGVFVPLFPQSWTQKLWRKPKRPKPGASQ